MPALSPKAGTFHIGSHSGTSAGRIAAPDPTVGLHMSFFAWRRDADLRYTHSQRGPMRQIAFFGALLATALELSVPALAQSGESAAGRRLARELCGDCHQARRPFPLLYRHPPSFEDIARLSSTTRLSLKVFLRSNHEQMPNFIISKSDTDPIIEYILSLKRQ